MANKHTKRCLTVLVNRDMQMKTTSGYHYTPTGMVHMKKKVAIVGKDVKQPELSYIAGGSANW